MTSCEHTAMDRAKAMGFDTPAYHGAKSPDNIEKKLTSSQDPSFSTSDQRIASSYADNEGGAVYPLLVNKGNSTDIGWGCKQFSTPDRNLFREYMKAKRSGYDSAHVKEIQDHLQGIDVTPHDVLINFTPQNIRSRFAAFDPMQRNSANILAGGAAGGIGINVLYDLMQQEEYQ